MKKHLKDWLIALGCYNPPMFEALLAWITHMVEVLGYPGIFLEALLESTFVPLAVEVTMVPAGYLVYQGKMDGATVLVLAILGTITGSLLNYWIARSCGRYLLVRYGKYMFLNEHKLEWIEGYFRRHGPISIFLGRLVFGVRHVISFPAGLARMNVAKFTLYTALGGGLWTAVLLCMGYLIGSHQDEVRHYLPFIKIGAVVVVALAGFTYWRHAQGKPVLEPDDTIAG